MKKNFKKCLLFVTIAAMATTTFAACNGGEDPEHTHSFKSGWTYDSGSHWHDADCGHDAQDGKEIHVFAEQVTQEPTCTETGTATYACACGYSYTGTVPALGHDIITLQGTAPGCEKPGKAPHDGCSRCDWEGDAAVIPATGIHRFSTTDWAHDDVSHWRPALCGCDRKGSEEAHTLVDGECKCGYVEGETPPPVEDELFLFELSGTNYVVAGLTDEGKASTTLEIPAEFNGKSVTGMKDHVFEDNATLVSVKVPASITVISREAFLNCTALQTVTLPSTLTKIGEAAFAGCTSLEDLAIPGNVTTIGASAFDGCTSLGNGISNGIVLPTGLTSLGKQAFANCTALESMLIPEGVTVIEDNLFLNCTSLATVTLHSDVERIGIQAFARCTALQSINLLSGLEQIGQSAFKGSGLTAVTVPNTVTTLGAQAFAECASLATATLSNGINYHFGAIFADCAALQSVTVPFVGSNVSASDAVTGEFGYYFGTNTPKTPDAFTKVGNYYIPNALVSVSVLGGTIAADAFDGCSHVATIYVAKNVVLPEALTGCSAKLIMLGKPEASITIGESAYLNEAIEISYTASLGSEVEITVKKGDVAAESTDYEFNADKTEITFKAVGTYTVTVTASANGETTDATATVAVDVRGPELTNVALDKTAINQNESVVLSYNIDSESTVQITVKNGDEIAEEGTDYTVSENTYTFITAGNYTITVSATRNGKPASQSVTVAVADTTVAPPVVTLTASEAEIAEGTAVTLTANVTYDTVKDDSEGTKAYAVYVKNGGSYENAAEELYEFNTDKTQITLKVAGEYKVELNVTSTKGQTAKGEALVTATVVTITLTEELAVTNAWVRVANAGGDLAYTVEGYAGGYAVTYTTDDKNASASAATSGTAVHVSTTASNTVYVTITYTHKSDSSIKKELTIPVSFVSDLDNAPVLAADPFGGTYGTLIPSTGLMLYHDVTLNGTQVAEADISYAVADISKLEGLKADGEVKIYTTEAGQKYVIIEDFDGNNNKSHGEISVKMTITVDGKTAGATKVFNVTAVGTNDSGKVTEYIKAVLADSYDSRVQFIGNANVRQNMVVSKTGILHQRNSWNIGGDFLRYDLNEENATNPMEQFQIDFKYTMVHGDKGNFEFRFRTGNWDGNGGSLAFRPDWGDDGNSEYMQVQGWLKGNEDNDDDIAGTFLHGDTDNMPNGMKGTSFYARVTRTFDGDTVHYKAYWSATGEAGTYKELCDYNMPKSNTNGKAGKYVYALQISIDGVGIYIENLQITSLDA